MKETIIAVIGTLVGTLLGSIVSGVMSILKTRQATNLAQVKKLQEKRSSLYEEIIRCLLSDDDEKIEKIQDLRISILIYGSLKVNEQITTIINLINEEKMNDPEYKKAFDSLLLTIREEMEVKNDE